jgi:sugar lactone lactonase YvrE
MDPVRVCVDPPFAEGPVGCRDDGTLVCTSVSTGGVYRVDPSTATCARLADVGGGANGAASATDGGFVVTQNGGLDFDAIGLVDDPPPTRAAPPGLQRVAADGRVTSLASAGCSRRTTSSSTATAPCGSRTRRRGRRPTPRSGGCGATCWTARSPAPPRGLWYPNGIAREPDGTLVVENGLLGRPHFGLVRLGPDGPQRFVDQAGDGFCLDEDGRCYVAGGRHGVTVLEPDGRTVEVLPLPGRGVTTNCCFGGADGRTLYATDAVPGGVWAWEGLPTPGLALLAWPAPPA